MFKKFETKLTLVFLTLFLAVQGLILTAVYVITDRNLGDRAKQQVLFSGQVLTRNLERQRLKLIEDVKILSKDFGFRTAIASGDEPTIASALHNLSARIDVHYAALIPVGSVEPVTFGLTRDQVMSGTLLGRLTERAELSGSASTLALIEGEIHEIALVPVLAPVPIAWIMLSRPVTDEVTAGLQKLLDQNTEVSFLSKADNGVWSMRASTLPKGVWRELELAMNVEFMPDGIPEILNLDEKANVLLSVSPGGYKTEDRFRAIVQYSLSAAFQPYLVLAISLSILSAAGFVVLATGSVIVARGMTKPLKQLNHAATLISAGNYHNIVDIDQKDEVGQLASSFNEMIRNIRDREEEITFQASHDIASGLPNLNAFQTHLEECLKDAGEMETTCGVVVLHLERLPEIQATFGHGQIEQLICDIGARLQSVVFEVDFIARLTTSSLAIALPGMGLARSVAIGQKIGKSFELPFRILNFDIDVGATVGLALFPVHAETAQDLVLKADIAAGQPSVNTEGVSVYDADTDRHTAEHLSLMTELKAGLGTDEIFFVYQPKVDLRTGVITHVEALVRWIHPTQGFISPEVFIPLAERTGNIHHLTAWALETAICQCGEWRRNNIELAVAVNLSTCDLANRDLPVLIARLLKQHGVAAESIVLEVTESAIMADADLALEILQRLNDMGHTLSIDDFGTGYSSMAYLKQLPVQELKIDKSFVLGLATNKDDEAIVQSTLDLASRLGLKVTAEGIEDLTTVEILKSFDCDMGQGFFLSRPVSPEEVVALLNQPGNFLETLTNVEKQERRQDA